MLKKCISYDTREVFAPNSQAKQPQPCLTIPKQDKKTYLNFISAVIRLSSILFILHHYKINLFSMENHIEQDKLLNSPRRPANQQKPVNIPPYSNNYQQPLLPRPIEENPESIQARKELREGNRQVQLVWGSQFTNVTRISSSNDYVKLTNLRESIMELKTHYVHKNSGLSIQGHKAEADEISRRFLLLQHEIDGLLRRRIDLATKDHPKGNRNLDISRLLLQKQSEITELQKENQNLRERLRRGSLSIEQLNAKIDKLNRTIAELRGHRGQALDNTVLRERKHQQLKDQLRRFKETFSYSVGIWQKQLKDFKVKFPQHSWELDYRITQKIAEENIHPIEVKGYAIVEMPSVKVRKWLREVSLNEELNLMIRKSFVETLQKYPQIKTTIDYRIIEFLSKVSYDVSGNDSAFYSNIDAVFDVLDEVSLNRLVQIVKYVPETIRVQNVYNYSSQRSKKIEFHLRVLIKVLLQQIDTLKKRYGAILEIDQGVVGMISQEIVDIVNIDDILKVFRVKERIVQVEKIVQKVVDKVVEVPKVVTIQKVIEKPVQVIRFKEIEKIVHQPVQIIKQVDRLVEKLVQVPTIIQKIVQVPVPVPYQVEKEKIVYVQKIVEKIIQLKPETKIQVVVQKENHIVYQPKIVEITKEVPIIKETIKEVIKQVIVYQDKIVELIVPRIIQVEKVVQKVTKVVEYKCLNQEKVVFVEKFTEVPVYIEKIVPVEKIVKIIQTVPVYIEKPIVIKEYVTEIKVVQTIVEKLFQKEKIKQVQVVKNVFVEILKEVIKPVDRIVQVPIIQQKIVSVPIQVPKVFIERIHVPHVVPVVCHIEKVIERPVYREIQVPKPIYIKDYQVVNCIEEKIVQIPRIVERIKQVRVKVEKVIRQLVEVPKVIEVQKIIEKIVVVPRVVQKIVKVPQIVEVVVEKIVEVPISHQVQKLIEKVVQKQIVKQVQIFKNIYHEVQRSVEVIKQIAVKSETVVQKIEVKNILVKQIVPEKTQFPVQIFVDKLVPVVVECAKIIPIESQKLAKVQVAKAIPLINQKVVKIERTIIEPQLIEKPVQLCTREETTLTNVLSVDKMIEKPVYVVQHQLHTEIRHVFNQKLVVVPQNSQKIVPVPQSKIVEKITEKAVEVRTTIHQQIPVEIKQQVPIQSCKVVELHKDKVKTGTASVPVIDTKIEYKYIQKPYPVYVYLKGEKSVTAHKTETIIKTETVHLQKIVPKENMTVVQDKVPCIQTKIEIRDKLEKRDLPPEFYKQEKIVLVNQFQEKIYERIIVMPQVVEVIKHVTEICEVQNSLIAEIDISIIEQETKYRDLYRLSRQQLQILLIEFGKIKVSQPSFSEIIELLTKYLLDFDKLASIRRIVPVEKIKIVEKEVPKPVVVPTQDSETIKNQIAYTLLIEKLIHELKRITIENSSIQLRLDADVSLFFFNQLHIHSQAHVSNDLQQNLAKYTQETLKKLASLGGSWAHSHELMLSTILAQRFTMSNIVRQANLQIERARKTRQTIFESYKKLQTRWLVVEKTLKDKRDALNRLLQNNATLRNYKDLIGFVEQINVLVERNVFCFEPIRIIETDIVFPEIWLSRIRELELEVTELKKKLVEWPDQHQLKKRIHQLQNTLRTKDVQIKQLEKWKNQHRCNHPDNSIINQLRNQVNNYMIQVTQLNQQITEFNLKITNYKTQITELTQNITKYEKKLISLTNDNKKLKVDHDFLSKKVENLQHEKAKVQSERYTLQHENSDLKAAKSNLQYENKNLNGLVAEKKNQISRLGEQISKYQKITEDMKLISSRKAKLSGAIQSQRQGNDSQMMLEQILKRLSSISGQDRREESIVMPVQPQTESRVLTSQEIQSRPEYIPRAENLSEPGNRYIYRTTNQTTNQANNQSSFQPTMYSQFRSSITNGNKSNLSVSQGRRTGENSSEANQNKTNNSFSQKPQNK